MIGNQAEKIIVYVYLDLISWKYNLNHHTVHLEPLELQKNSLHAVLKRFHNH